jgi:hypothetical protein
VPAGNSAQSELDVDVVTHVVVVLIVSEDPQYVEPTPVRF